MKAYQYYAGWGWYSKPGQEVTEADVQELFDAKARHDPLRKEHVYETLHRLMPTDKYGPFDSVGITKTIKRIRLCGGVAAQKDLEKDAQVADASPPQRRRRNQPHPTYSFVIRRPWDGFWERAVLLRPP